MGMGNLNGKRMTLKLFVSYLFLLLVQLCFSLPASATDPLDTWTVVTPPPTEFFPSPATYALENITFANGGYMAVGDVGTVLTSPGGSDWTAQLIDTFNASGVAFGNGVYAVVFLEGLIRTSTDSTIWTERLSNLSTWFSGIAYGNGAFAAVGGTIYTSPDGQTWTENTPNPAISYNFSDISFVNNKFYAVGDGIYSSTNGATWNTVLQQSASFHISGITYGNGQYVAVGWNWTETGGKGDAIVYTSPTGNAGTWIQQTAGLAGVKRLDKIAFANNTFVAVGGEGSGQIVSSTDGQSWTQRASGAAYNLNGIATSQGIFVAVGNSGEILHSQPVGISAAPSSLSYGNVVPVGNTSTPQTLSITNYGASNLIVGQITISGTNATEFSKMNDACSGKTLIPTGSCSLQVVFTPGSVGTKQATVQIPSNDPVIPFAAIDLSGTVSAQITVTPQNLAWGDLPAGSAALPKAVEVTNSGVANLIIGQLTIGGTNPSDFNLQNDTCSGHTLAPSASCSFQALFTPATNGPKVATILVPSNDPANPTRDIALSGYRICVYSISPHNQSYLQNGGAGTIAITTDSSCSWTATSDNSWLTITTANSGSGTGSVGYSVSANPDSNTRIGVITAGNQSFVIVQSPQVCTTTLSSTTQSFSATGGSGSFTVNSSSCGSSWLAESQESWINISTIPQSGVWSGVNVNFNVNADGSAFTATGSTLENNAAKLTTVYPASCGIAKVTGFSYSDTAITNGQFSTTVGDVTVQGRFVNSNTAIGSYSFAHDFVSYYPFYSVCHASASGSWISSPASGNGTVHYSIAANLGKNPRTGTITVSGTIYTIIQDGTEYPLTVQKNGIGSGAVLPDTGSLSWSGNVGTGSFLANMPVTLTATADPGNVFTGWSGACNGTGICTITMDSAKSVAATFTNPNAPVLTVNISGNGSVHGTSTNMQSYACASATCPPSPFAVGDQVTLIPVSASTSIFSGWSGACTNATGNCILTMTNNKTVSATFAAAPKVKVASKKFSTLQTAYDDTATTNESIIKLLEGVQVGGLNATRGINVKIEGGYNAAYNGVSSETIISGTLKVRAGAVRMKGIAIR